MRNQGQGFDTRHAGKPVELEALKYQPYNDAGIKSRTGFFFVSGMSLNEKGDIPNMKSFIYTFIIIIFWGAPADRISGRIIRPFVISGTGNRPGYTVSIKGGYPAK